MALTSPDNIWSPDGTDGYALTTHLATLADSVQDAVTTHLATLADSVQDAVTKKANYVWADATARGAETGMIAGKKGYQTDTGVVYRYDGSAWKAWESDWIAYTPTLTNFTIGTGGSAINTAAYRYAAGRVVVKGHAILGTSGQSVGSSVSLTLPVTRAALAHNWQGCPGIATAYDDSAGVNYTSFVAATLGSVTAVTLLLPGTNGSRVAISASTPFTWGAGDAISYDFEYDPA